MASSGAELRPAGRWQEKGWDESREPHQELAVGRAAPPPLSSAPSMGVPWVLTLCGPCADLREAPQRVSSGAEHPIVQCSLLSGSPQTGGWEAGRGQPEEGAPQE